MNRAGGEESPQSFIVIDSMNSHGALTVQSADTRATYHVVDYADTEARERLASLTEGAQVRMSVSRAGVRANVWTAKKVVTGSAEPTTARA
ncbi:hypothetical protein C2R22_14005 [Salinigranum rubrum]|uniref:DUF7999 domain-containing protein n=2 Tax=Salinigranum rubrum TaxID=755307 RepID=A0A2I8VL47_9EURY|nr:hypothetical protein C2R22_14005 [Salinigranum rubrum]